MPKGFFSQKNSLLQKGRLTRSPFGDLVAWHLSTHALAWLDRQPTPISPAGLCVSQPFT